MELLAGPAVPRGKTNSFCKNPLAWVRDTNFSRGYWIFFSAAFFFDAGFSIYFFLFNLFLLDCRFNERAMGWVGGALTLGSMAGTLPAGALARRFGLRPLLIALFVAAPLVNVLRALLIREPAEIGLAFLAGFIMSAWGVCFLPAVARLTTKKNRTAGFSAIFSVSIATGMLGGIVCGYLREWLARIGFPLQPVEVKRLILLASCALVLAGLIPVVRLRVPASTDEDIASEPAPARLNVFSKLALSPFLLRFLPAMALWSAVLAAFTPFANVYLSRNLQVPMEQIGIVFSAAQLLQLCMGIAAPFLFRRLGLVSGIAATQIAAAVVLGALAIAASAPLAILLYLVFSAAQWMSSPGLYNFLMNETPDQDRSTAASLTLFANALAGSLATAATGVLLTRFGYRPVLFGIALEAMAIALLFLALFHPLNRRAPAK